MRARSSTVLRVRRDWPHTVLRNGASRRARTSGPWGRCLRCFDDVRWRGLADSDDHAARHVDQRNGRVVECCGGREHTWRHRGACLHWCRRMLTRRLRRVGLRCRDHHHATHPGGAGTCRFALAHRKRATRPARRRRELEREESDDEGEAPEDFHVGKVVRAPGLRSDCDSRFFPHGMRTGVISFVVRPRSPGVRPRSASPR